MEYGIIMAITIFASLVLGRIFYTKARKIKEIAKNEELDEIAKKYPDNLTLCRAYLKKLKNETVKIEENKETQASLYIAITNKISIANISHTYTRIQTIAHECLHSVQSKKVLWFNFIFSNLYLLYYLIICLLAIFGWLPNPMMFLVIGLIGSCMYLLVRMYLENDAMIKARFLVEEYMKENSFATDQENQKILDGLDELNPLGMQYMHYQFFLNEMVKVFVFCVINFLRLWIA